MIFSPRRDTIPPISVLISARPRVRSAAKLFKPGGPWVGCPGGTEDVDALLGGEFVSDPPAVGDLIIFVFFFPDDLTGARFFLFLPERVTGPDNSGEAPNSSSGLEGSSSPLQSSADPEPGVWKTASVDSVDSLTDMEYSQVGSDDRQSISS